MRVVTTKTNTWWNFYFYYLEWFLCKLNLFVRSSQAIIHWSYIAYPFDQINFRKSMLAFIGVKRHELFINDPDWAITNHPQNQKKNMLTDVMKFFVCLQSIRCPYISRKVVNMPCCCCSYCHRIWNICHIHKYSALKSDLSMDFASSFCVNNTWCVRQRCVGFEGTHSNQTYMINMIFRHFRCLWGRLRISRCMCVRETEFSENKLWNCALVCVR